jgi:hypothetical protein
MTMLSEAKPPTSLFDLIASTPDFIPDEPAPWEAVVPLDAASPLPLAGDLLPGALGAFCRALAAATETPIELALLTILSSTAACVAGHVVVQPEQGYIEPLNLWTLAALEPGNRKTAVLSQATEPLRQWESDQAALMKPQIERANLEHEITEERIKALKHQACKAGSGELPMLMEAIQTERASLPPMPKAQRLLVNDVTSEKLALLLAENDERLCLASDEGGIIGTIGGRYSGKVSNLDIWLQAYSGAPVRVDRISREPLILHAPVLSVVLSPQPAVVKTMPAEFLQRGFLDRFILAMPISPVGYRSLEPHPIPLRVKEDYAAQLYRLLAFESDRREDGQRIPHVVVLSQEAWQAWKAFSRAIEKSMRPGGSLEFIKGWGAKLAGNLARVAGVLHLANTPGDRPWEQPMSNETMVAAIRLMTGLIPHALIVFDAVGADPELETARYALAWIKREARSEFSARDLLIALKGRYKTMQEIRPALTILQDRHYLRSLPAPKREGRGRPPAPRYEVSPQVLGKAP